MSLCCITPFSYLFPLSRVFFVFFRQFFPHSIGYTHHKACLIRQNWGKSPKVINFPFLFLLTKNILTKYDKKIYIIDFTDQNGRKSLHKREKFLNYDSEFCQKKLVVKIATFCFLQL